MIHAELCIGRVRTLAAAIAIVALTACGGGGGGSKGGGNPGGGSSATDTTPPDTGIVTKPDAVTNSTSASFTFSASETGASFEVSVDGTAFVASTASLNLTSIAEGDHTLSVRAIDAAKNVDATPATATWRVDTSAPTAQVFFPPAYSYTDASQITLRGKVTDPSGATLKVDGADVTVASDGTWSAPVQVAAGNNTIVLSTTDTLGNNDASAATLHVTNNGPAMSYVRGMDLDANHNRLLLADYERLQILALDLTTGRTSVFAGYDANSSAKLAGVSNLVVDATGNRVVAVDLLGDQLVAIDLDTKVRTVISDATNTSYVGLTRLVGTDGDLTGLALDLANNLAYVTRGRDSQVHSSAGVIKIHLDSGVREVVSGMGGGDFGNPTVGSGYSLTAPSDVVVDTIAHPSRLLVADGQHIVAIDPATGDGTLFFDGSSSFGYITRMKLDDFHQNLLVTSSGANLPHGIFAIDLSSPASSRLVDTDSIGAQIDGAYTLAVDIHNGRVYFGNVPTVEMYTANLGGSPASVLAHSNVGSGPRVVVPNSVKQSGDDLYFADSAQPALVKLNLATGERAVVSSNAIGSGPSLNYFSDFALDAQSNRALVPDGLNSLIAVNLNTGERALLSGGAVPVGSGTSFFQATAAAWDPVAQRAFVLDEIGSTPTLVSVDSQGNRTKVADLPHTTLPSANRVVLDRTSDSAATHAIVSLDTTPYDVDLTTGAVSSYAPARALGMWMYPDNRVLLAADSQAVTRFDFNNAPQLVSGRGNGASAGSGIDMLFPTSIVADPSTNVGYVADTWMFGIIAIDLTSGERVLISR